MIRFSTSHHSPVSVPSNRRSLPTASSSSPASPRSFPDYPKRVSGLPIRPATSGSLAYPFPAWRSTSHPARQSSRHSNSSKDDHDKRSLSANAPRWLFSPGPRLLPAWPPPRPSRSTRASACRSPGSSSAPSGSPGFPSTFHHRRRGFYCGAA